MTDAEQTLRHHRALAEPSRVQILADITAHGPVDAQTLAERVGLHPNTVRAHLAALTDAGLVRSEQLRGPGRGRPRLAYSATGAEQTALRRYRLLAEILTTLVARSAADNRQELEAIGEAWGHHLVDSPPPFAQVAETEALDRLTTMLGESGFAPSVEQEADGARILMRPCPFLELAHRHPDVVCPVHLGLMRGALHELGGTLRPTRLDPFVREDLCVAHLAAVRDAAPPNPTDVEV